MTRIITGAVGVLILIPVCIFSGTFIWPLVITLFSLIATEELLRCLSANEEKQFAIPARIFSLLPLFTYLITTKFVLLDMFRCIFLFSALFFFTEQIIAMINKNRYPTEKLYSLIALNLYVTVCLTAISQIRYIDNGNQEGKYIYLLMFLGAWISDTFAYFTGKYFGKNLLAPEISPKKTIEGSIGGVVANMIAFAGYAWLLRGAFDVNANIIFFAILGALFSAVGQFGDLFASGIKRHFGIKDYGKLFPGHGGVLDRFDSTLAIAGVMLLVYAAFGSAFLIQ
ncbi:MAG: phosphatidate cytidylyltransferase [Clostridia bacterium]|nr:phosphatidate cytidylyltransferase [Clostridia bacterium]